jgi:hypothetical protein
MEMGPIVSRYSGSLPDGSKAEICLFHQVDRKDSHNSLQYHHWFQRFRLTRLINCTSCLTALDFEETGKQPFVAFPSGSVSLQQLITDRVLIESELDELAKACLAALVACTDVGLVIGGVTPRAIRLGGIR